MATFLDLAYEILKEAEEPLVPLEIWRQIEEKGLRDSLGTTGKTPWRTLGARLYVDVRDNPDSKFVKLGAYPARFWLKERDLPMGWTPSVVSEPSGFDETSTFNERDLHPVLSYFVYSSITFNRGRPVYTKTIKHERSKKGGFGEWTHPDMVGFSFPAEEWDSSVIELVGSCGDSALKLFSFEIKRSLERGNYREAFFQAVSNSSWAHEGYLVTAKLNEDDDLVSELSRLSQSFGIGLIVLDLRNVAESEVILPARQKDIIDWETVNKLAQQNEDFRDFITHVKIDVSSKFIHKDMYDKIEQNIEAYVREKLKVS